MCIRDSKGAMDATRIAVPYHPAVYERLNGLHHNVQTFLAACNTVGASSSKGYATLDGTLTSANATIPVGTPRRPSMSPRQGSLSPRRFSTRGQTPRGAGGQQASGSGDGVASTPADIMDRHIQSEEERLATACLLYTSPSPRDS
eukprot:TRINITY_DN14757_c0_g1_i3.p2 TRINITY_DN14757_c0_g1~~TRINITY_DN14757_c0_g1_i3.p2  ORF type:complete len:145 (+),score=33.30 TRINITY_DN14757_c0_g1_i3:158-592(+)